MASALSKQRNYKYMAEKYSELNEMQVEFGKKLVVLLGVKPGQKILDMGCGTGEITAFIADQVGGDGQAVGVDPDEQRIKVATQKHCHGRRNISFMAGDSSSHFPNFDKQYFDIHFSNFVFLWLTPDEKRVFLEIAFRCLKPGGQIALHSQEENPEIFYAVPELVPDDEIEDNRTPIQLIKKSVMESMLKESGFVILSSEYVPYEHKFPSLDYFLKWFCASSYVDESKLLQHKKEAFAKKFVSEDGTVYLKIIICRTIAQKQNTNS